MPREVDETRAYRDRLVRQLRRDGHLRSERVEAAMRAIPRELFVPGVPLEEVYSPGEAIVTKRVEGVSVSSASSPEVIALMLEQLAPQPGDRVLEIGTGTGYNAALLAHVVGESGQVVSMDIDEDLVLSARDHLANAGYGHVTTVHADGALGFAPAAPYDRIVLTVASSDIAPAWREQLAQPYGRLVLPLALRGLQRCALFQTDPADSACLVSRSPRSCSFVALRGAMGATGVRGPIEQGATMAVCASEEALAVSVETLGRLIAQPLRELPSGVAATPEEIRSGLHLWLLAREPRLRSVWATAGLPDLFGLGKRAGARGTLCIVDATDPSVALLTWAQERETGGELSVLATPGAERLSERLRQLLVEWSAAGGPGDADLSIRAYPSEHGVARVSGEVVLEQPWTHFVLNWAKPQPPAILTV